MAKKDSTDQDAPIGKVEYHQLKSNLFRVIHVDGGIGGLTTRGLCHLALYNERAAIPKIISMSVGENGQPGPERVIDVLGSDDAMTVVRELEVDLIFDGITAIQIRDWLNRRIDELEKAGILIKDNTNGPPQ